MGIGAAAPSIDKKGKIIAIEDDIIVPRSRAEFDEVTAAMKNKNKRQSPEFMAIGR